MSAQLYRSSINIGEIENDYYDERLVTWMNVNKSYRFWNIPLSSVILNDKNIIPNDIKVAAINLANPFLYLPSGYFL